METYYHGLKAHRHLRKMGFKGQRNGKGAGKRSGTGAPSETHGTCRDSGQKGRWKGDPECPMVKTGESKPFVKKGSGKGSGNGKGLSSSGTWVGHQGGGDGMADFE